MRRSHLLDRQVCAKPVRSRVCTGVNAATLRRPALVAVLGAAALPLALLGSATGAGAGTLSFSIANVGKCGGEPVRVSDGRGLLYDATPSGGTVVYRSTDRGATWQPATVADTKSGDDCLGVDQSEAVYMCKLAGSQGNAPLQADEWKSVDQGATWSHGAGLLPQCATSCNPFGVDRDWTDAAILPPNTTTDNAEVVLMYHDFYGPTQIWVNISQDAGK